MYIYIFLFIYIYLVIKLSPPPATAGSACIMPRNTSKGEAKLKKEEKIRKFPLYAL